MSTSDASTSDAAAAGIEAVAGLSASLADQARGLLPAAVDLRRRIHRQPELGLELPRTQSAVLEALEGLPLTVATGSGTTSVTAVLEGAEEGPTVLLRGDMDALPMPEDTGLDYASEVEMAMHACGHDAHVAMLAGAARLLSERRDEIAGRVVFMFQPGEEGHGGAQVMLDEGVLGLGGGVEAAFGLHITPSIPAGMIGSRPGPLMASADSFEITVMGKGGHASQPHHTIDPIPVACEIVLALNVRMTRRIDAFNPGILTVGRISSGTTNNVIPESATIIGTIRAISEQTRKQILDGCKQVAEGIAVAHDCTATVELRDGYPVTINDVDQAPFLVEVAGTLLGADRAITMPTPVMGAEDFSYILQQVPGAMAFLGAMPEGVAPGAVAPNHSNRMLISEESMADGIAVHAAVALGYLAGGSRR